MARRYLIFVLLILFSSHSLAADKKFETCRDGSEWLSRSASFTYFKDHYYEFNKRLLALAKNSDVYSFLPNNKQVERLEFLHQQVTTLIYELGRLLPRVERSMDLPGMMQQMNSSAIKAPMSDDKMEFLRVVFAREILATDKAAGPSIAQFLNSLMQLDELLLATRSHTTNAVNAEPINQAFAKLSVTYKEGFRPFVKSAIFAPELTARLQQQAIALCDPLM